MESAGGPLSVERQLGYYVQILSRMWLLGLQAKTEFVTRSVQMYVGDTIQRYGRDKQRLTP